MKHLYRGDKSKRNIAAFVTVLSGLAIGSVAWQDISQFKTNMFRSSDEEFNVVLVEDFQEVSNLRLGQVVKQNVAVRNGQDSDDESLFSYQDVYVRVNFKEFMEMGKEMYVYSKERLMVDAHGNFIRDHSRAGLEAYMQEHGIENVARIVQLKGYFDSKDAPINGYYYIVTGLKDPNGQFGKFLAIDKVNIDHDNHGGHDDAWAVHVWSEDALQNYAKPSSFTPYFQWMLGANVMALSAWDQVPTPKWLVDTDSDEGWVYWGQPLKHGTKAIDGETITSSLLESVKFINQPQGSLSYYIRVNLDAISLDALAEWRDAPQKIIDGLNPNTLSDREALKAVIDRVEFLEIALTPLKALTTLNDTLKETQAVYANPLASSHDLNDKKQALDSALGNYLAIVENGEKSGLLKEFITDLKTMDLREMTQQSRNNLQKTIQKAHDLAQQKDVPDAVIDEMFETLNGAVRKLNNLDGPEAYPIGIPGVKNHYYVEVSGLKWEVLGKDVENVIVLSPPISPSQFAKMGLSDMIAPDYPNALKQHNLVPYSHVTGENYKTSNVATIAQRFYDTYLKGTPDESLVVPVLLRGAERDDQIGSYRYDTQKTEIGTPSNPLYDPLLFRKQAFVLSTGDVAAQSGSVNHFVYYDSTPLWGGGYYWLRSSANAETSHVISNRSLPLISSSSKTDSPHQVRLAIVLKSISLPFSDSTLNGMVNHHQGLQR